MPNPLATPDDVQDQWRPFTDDTEEAKVERLVATASDLLRQATPPVPSLDARIAMYAVDPTTLQALSPRIVAGVVAGIVKRFLVNPLGATSQTETVGPFSHSTSFALRGDKDIRGVMMVTEEDLKALRPYQPKNRVGSIRVRPSLAPFPFGDLGSCVPVRSIDILLTEIGNEPVVVEFPVPIGIQDGWI